MGRKTIAVDLDGVIFEYDEWRGVEHFGKPVKGVREAFRKLKEAGFIIVIYTTRLNQKINPRYGMQRLYDLVRDALLKNGIPFDEIEVWGKPIAEYYIDDRAVRFETWAATVKFIEWMEQNMETTQDLFKEEQ